MQIGCAVVLYNNKIVSWKMNRDIRIENVSRILKQKYFGSYNPKDCEIKVELFEGNESGGWGLKTDVEAENWRKQWEIDPGYQELIDKKIALPPYRRE